MKHLTMLKNKEDRFKSSMETFIAINLDQYVKNYIFIITLGHPPFILQNAIDN